MRVSRQDSEKKKDIASEKEEEKITEKVSTTRIWVRKINTQTNLKQEKKNITVSCNRPKTGRKKPSTL